MTDQKTTINKTTKKSKRKVIPCLVYSRVVGYYRPTVSYNKGKEQEWKERKLIDETIEWRFSVYINCVII